MSQLLLFAATPSAAMMLPAALRDAATRHAPRGRTATIRTFHESYEYSTGMSNDNTEPRSVRHARRHSRAMLRCLRRVCRFSVRRCRVLLLITAHTQEPAVKC